MTDQAFSWAAMKRCKRLLMYTGSIANRNGDSLELGSHRPTASIGTHVDQDSVSHSEYSILSHDISPCKHPQSQYTEYGFIIQWGLENGVVCSHEDQASLSSF